MIRKIFILLILNFNIFSLNMQDAKKIGMLIWNNETSKRLDLLVFWNPYEDFPSLGIGHFIWPKNNSKSPFAKLCHHLKKNRVVLSKWLDKAKNIGSPWESRNEFLQDKKHRDELLDLLSSTMDLQVSFMIEQLEEQWPIIVSHASENQREKIVYIFQLMRASFLGNYALIDYLNFKGSGLNKNQNWGLLQVLLNMPEGLTQENVNKAFAVSAAQILIKRIANSYPNYSIIRFLNGWIKRITTYIDLEIINNNSTN